MSDGTIGITGGNTKWFSYGSLKVQGTYELRVCAVLDEAVRLGEISSWDYTNDRVSYTRSNGKPSTYLLDFKVVELDGTVRYIEVKGWQREDDVNKWRAARETGLTLDVWFLKEIKYEEDRLGLKFDSKNYVTNHEPSARTVV